VPPPPTKIVLAADAFAYLPIHALNKLKPSEGGEAWDEKFEIISDPQAGICTSVVKAPGDMGCIQRIIAEQNLGNFVVGICDPLEILRSGQETELRIIGGLINRPCFWMVADAHSGHTMSTLDIEFFCQHHSELLTAFMWSNTIFDEISNRNHRELRPIQRIEGSFDDVIDGAVFLKQKCGASRIAALTPCVLSVALLSQKHPSDWNVFKLFDDPRYDKSLTTAFVVHKDALNSINKEFHERASYLMSQVILIVNFFRNNPSEMSGMIQRLCKDVNRFAGERQIDATTSVTGNRISSALKRKIKNGIETLFSLPVNKAVSDKVYELLEGSNGQDIFCSACEISEIEWTRAVEFRLPHLQKSKTAFELFYDNKLLKIAQDRVVQKSLYGAPAHLVDFHRKIFQERAYFARCVLWFPSVVIFLAVILEFGFYKTIVFSIISYLLCFSAFFGILKTPKTLKWIFEKIQAKYVITGGWLVCIVLIIWGISFAVRMIYFGIDDLNDDAKLAEWSVKFSQYRAGHYWNYNITSIFGLLDRSHIQRDDAYGITTLAVSVWLSLTIGYPDAKRALRRGIFILAGWWPFRSIRRRLRGSERT
jgi:hypothetical protein